MSGKVIARHEFLRCTTLLSMAALAACNWAGRRSCVCTGASPRRELNQKHLAREGVPINQALYDNRESFSV